MTWEWLLAKRTTPGPIRSKPRWPAWIALLLISSNEIGQRAAQHLNVIEAARRKGVKVIVYTSLLHADRSPLGLAAEHQVTEEALRGSGIPFVILRNGWYCENYTGSIPGALANGAFVGSAGEGRISAVPRADYAEAAAVVLAGEGHEGRVYELAGDCAFTLADLAAELSRQVGRQIPYRDLPEAEYAAVLKGVGLPDGLARAIASWDVGASQGCAVRRGAAAVGAHRAAHHASLRGSGRRALSIGGPMEGCALSPGGGRGPGMAAEVEAMAPRVRLPWGATVP